MLSYTYYLLPITYYLLPITNYRGSFVIPDPTLALAKLVSFVL